MTFADWMLGIGAVLVTAGVAGVWKLSNSLSALNAQVAAWTRTFESRFVVVTDNQNDHSKRISRLETQTAVHDVKLTQFNPKGKSDVCHDD